MTFVCLIKLQNKKFEDYISAETRIVEIYSIAPNI